MLHQYSFSTQKNGNFGDRFFFLHPQTVLQCHFLPQGGEVRLPHNGQGKSVTLNFIKN